MEWPRWRLSSFLVCAIAIALVYGVGFLSGRYSLSAKLQRIQSAAIDFAQFHEDGAAHGVEKLLELQQLGDDVSRLQDERADALSTALDRVSSERDDALEKVEAAKRWVDHVRAMTDDPGRLPPLPDVLK